MSGRKPQGFLMDVFLHLINFSFCTKNRITWSFGWTKIHCSSNTRGILGVLQEELSGEGGQLILNQ